MVSKTQKEIKPSNPMDNRDGNNEIEDFCDENFSILQKIHSILINCSNMTQKQKREFCENERFFMKQFLKKLLEERR